MTYMLKSDPTHPLKGAQFELFPISWLGDKTGNWIRDDENGKRWGFNHPDSGEVVAIHPAGTGPTPNLGQITSAFSVIVVDVEVEEDEPVSKLSSSAVEMGRPELRQNEKEE